MRDGLSALLTYWLKRVERRWEGWRKPTLLLTCVDIFHTMPVTILLPPLHLLNGCYVLELWTLSLLGRDYFDNGAEIAWRNPRIIPERVVTYFIGWGSVIDKGWWCCQCWVVKWVGNEASTASSLRRLSFSNLTVDLRPPKTLDSNSHSVHLHHPIHQASHACTPQRFLPRKLTVFASKLPPTVRDSMIANKVSYNTMSLLSTLRTSTGIGKLGDLRFIVEVVIWRGRAFCRAARTFCQTCWVSIGGVEIYFPLAPCIRLIFVSNPNNTRVYHSSGEIIHQINQELLFV